MHYILAQNSEKNDNSNIITILGILSMILSLIGNLKQIEEMYPLFLHNSRKLKKKTLLFEYIEEIPISMFVSCLSDVCLLLYGIYIDDIIIIIYGTLNSVLLLIVVLSIQVNINMTSCPAIAEQISETRKSDWKESIFFN